MYQFKEVTLKNRSIEKKVLVIEFVKKEMKIVAEFLMTDASLLNYEILDLIERVLSGASVYEVFSGNRISLTIKKDKSTITDLFEGMYDGFDTFPAYTIETKDLKEFILVWKDEADKY